MNNNRDSSNFTLTPDTFVFSTMGSNDDSILSIYIQTKESGNPGGYPGGTFSLHNNPVLPIPQGYDSSIILSYSLLQKYLSIQLASFQTSFSSRGDSGGFTLSISNSNLDLFTATVDGKGRTTKFDTPLNINASDSTLSVQYHSSSSTFWSFYNPGYQKVTFGSADITADINKNVPIHVNSLTGIESLQNFLNTNDLSIHSSPRGCSVWESLSGCQEYYPYVSKGSLLINLNFKGINVVATEHVLVPDMHVIFDTNKGVNIPLDMLLVGQIADQESYREILGAEAAHHHDEL